ncbi:MAG: nucleotidyl transferase AbiEii/AbiGii toxin family protein [Betaproteobacteria bacterium]
MREAEVSCDIKSFDVHERLGTKMRALFQRTRGRDLFDLYHALVTRPDLRTESIIDAFLYYMKNEGTVAHREEFELALQERLRNRGFRSDMQPLLRAGLTYDVDVAGPHVRQQLLALLPSEAAAK